MRKILGFLITLLVCLPALPAVALISDWQKAEFSAIRLIAGEVETAADAPPLLHAAIEVELKDGWKTYWRSPGDAGFPMTVTPTDAAENVESATLRWPAPRRFVEEWGLEVFGFKEKVTIPVEIAFEKPGEPALVDLQVNYAVCSDICISEEQAVSLAIPADYAPDAGHAAQVAQAWQMVPQTSGAGGMTIDTAEIREEADGSGMLAVEATTINGVFINPDLFLEGGVGLRFPLARTVLTDMGKRVIFLVPYEIAPPAKTLAGETVQATLVHGNRAVEGELHLGDAPVPPPSEEPAAAESEPAGEVPVEDSENKSGRLLAMILAALLGGLILNVMPCVLPVLSIKLLSVVKHGGGDLKDVRASFAMTVLGILAFFAGLAWITIAAKHAGEAVGWGFHFQSPTFLVFLASIILLAAANLLGVFEIALPSWMSEQVVEASHSQTVRRHQRLSDFLTGLFAALMATPCTAPFLGTAIGFALAGGDTEIWIIFLALGLGLALPYMLAMLFPQMVTRLPKPGAWMGRIKGLMGVLMLLAAIWLLWVLVGQTGVRLALGVLAVTLAMGMVLHGRSEWPAWQKPGRALLALAGLLLLLFFMAQAADRSMATLPPVTAESVEWRAFDEAVIAAQVAAGKVVFVDITADWCLTCKANKLYTLTDGDVIAALRGEKVVALQGDLTNPDATIEAYIRKHGRYGIPFNIVYGPGAPEGKLLPELLSPSLVLDALAAAAKP